MPLPDHAFTVCGGCHCHAVRHKFDIPAKASRPLNPYRQGDSGNEDEIRVPMVAIDHCNDCRNACGWVLPIWLATPIAFVTTSLIPRTEGGQSRGPWLPAAEVFKRDSPASRNSYLACYESSENRTRWFCGRCGTSLAYVLPEMPKGWPPMIDIPLGTLDREYLAKDWFSPERHLWWDCGIPWVHEFVTGGAANLPKHPLSNMNDNVQEGTPGTKERFEDRDTTMSRLRRLNSTDVIP